VAFHKAWTWAGVFSDELMVCIAKARVGYARASWWTIWDGAEVHERRRRSWRGIRIDADGASAEAIDLTFARGEPIEVRTGPAWTRKTPLRVTGTVRGRSVDAPGLLDESAGRHARHTAWTWSAGAGEGVVWNLVRGLHDGSPSERTVWREGVPEEVGDEAFTALRPTTLATVAHRENYLVIASSYEQSFCSFEGELRGRGVMERHEARW
jgi:hypothetical protein